MDSLGKPYSTLLFDVVGGRYVNELPKLLRSCGPLLSVELGSGESQLIRALQYQEIEGLFLTRAWLSGPLGSTARALLALRSLGMPIFVLWEGGQSQLPDAYENLLSLFEPIFVEPAFEGGTTARILHSLMAARHRFRWLNRLEFDRPRSQILAQLSDILVDPSTGVTSPSLFSGRLNEVMATVRSEGSGVSCIIAEMRWKDGAPATLSPRALNNLDKALRGCLRESDVVGKVAPGVYLILLPGQGAAQALIPAQRLFDTDWSQVDREFQPSLGLVAGLSGRDAPPTDGITFILEAEKAMGCGDSNRQSGIRVWGNVAPCGLHSPMDHAHLKSWGGSLLRTLPGLFPAPFSDRHYLAAIRGINPEGNQPPAFGVFSGWADQLAKGVGLPISLRRTLWRATLAGEALSHSLRPDEGEQPVSNRARGPKHIAREVVELLRSVPGLSPELFVLQDVRRRFRGRVSGEVTGHGDGARVARVLEVVESFSGLIEGDPAIGILEIEQVLLGGRNWRYDPTVVDAFVHWLRANQDELGL